MRMARRKYPKRMDQGTDPVELLIQAGVMLVGSYLLGKYRDHKAKKSR